MAKAERLACCPALVMILDLGNSGGGLKQPGGRVINEQTKGKLKGLKIHSGCIVFLDRSEGEVLM